MVKEEGDTHMKACTCAAVAIGCECDDYSGTEMKGLADAMQGRERVRNLMCVRECVRVCVCVSLSLSVCLSVRERQT